MAIIAAETNVQSFKDSIKSKVLKSGFSGVRLDYDRVKFLNVLPGKKTNNQFKLCLNYNHRGWEWVKSGGGVNLYIRFYRNRSALIFYSKTNRPENVLLVGQHPHVE